MDMKKTGRLIARKRKSMHLTREQLASKINVSVRTVEAWEKGERYPDIDVQIQLHHVLGLNPLEILSGLEMYDEKLKNEIALFMKRLDEKVFVSGIVKDENGTEAYFDLSDYEVPLVNENGELSGRFIPYTEYYNVLPPKHRPDEDLASEDEYDTRKVYLNCGSNILVVPKQILETMGKPLFYDLAWNEKKRVLALRFTKEIGENGNDIPEIVYNRDYKGIRHYGGEFGKYLCKIMKAFYGMQPLEAFALLDQERNAVVIPIDHAKKSNVRLSSEDFFLPKWQEKEMMDEFQREIDEEEAEDEE